MTSEQNVTVGALRAELVGWPDDTPVTVAIPDALQPSVRAFRPVVAAGYGPGFEGGSDPVLASTFPLTAAPHEDPVDVDTWAAPANMLGQMDPQFYAGIGLVVTLSALLEDRLRSLLQAVRQVAQTTHSKDGAHRLTVELRRRARHLGADWSAFEAFADRVDEALDARNAYVHSLWQLKSEGFYGHRIDPDTGQRESSTVTLDDLRAHVRMLVELNTGWQYWYMLAGVRPPKTPRR